jgi:tRNA(Ile)-lysidine synthase
LRLTLGASPFDVLDRHLAREAKAPLGVAVSGGGDSMMALMLVRAWASQRGRQVIVFSVDHAIQPQSATWLAFVRAAAERMGCGWRPGWPPPPAWRATI